MRDILVKPGDVVVTNMGIYQHWSLVSNRVCENGFYKLISASQRTGTVQEESWLEVTQGKKTYVAEYTSAVSVYDALTAARSQIGKWAYSVTGRNCEHFVKWATGLEVTSTQVKAGVAGAAVGAVSVAVLCKEPKLAKFLAGALIVGGIATFVARATEKNESTVRELEFQ